MLAQSEFRWQIAKLLAQSYPRSQHRGNLLGNPTRQGELEMGMGKRLDHKERDLAYEAFEDLRRTGLIRSTHEDTSDPDNWVTITEEGLQALRNGTLEKRVIFLSHAAADASIASSLKQVVEAAIPGADVFVSSDPEDLAPGDPWVRKILETLRAAQAFLILATKRSLDRKWVWLELGAGWAREAPVIPCCLGEVRKNSLPVPFLELQGLNLDVANDLRGLLDTLGRACGTSAKEADTGKAALELEQLDMEAAAERQGNAQMGSPEIDRRLEDVDLSAGIHSGLAANFLILFANLSEEEVTVKRIILERQGVRLTGPFFPPSPGAWKLPPKGSLPIGNRADPDPAGKLFELNANEGLGFRDTIELVVSCGVLNKTKTITIRKVVKVTPNLKIVEVAG